MADSPTTNIDDLTPSVWGTLKDKPNDEDVRYAETEEEASKYNGKLMTSRGEILTWYLYEWGNSPMFNVMIALVLPLFLSELATHYGCDHQSENGCDYENNLIGKDEPNIVYIGSIAVVPASYTFTIISISGALQATAYIGIGALADYSYYQYYLFRITAWIASIMLIVYVFLTEPTTYLFAGWWVAFQLVFTGLSIIFYNAYLPHMVENHWFVRRAIRNKKDQNEIVKLKQQLTDDISQYAFAIGYCGAFIMVIITVMVFGIMAETQYEQYEGYGITTNSNSNSFNEEWLKKVYKVDMSFDNELLIRIQIFYQDINIDGGIYGDNTKSISATFEVTDNDYISKIDYWYNSDGSINSMRFKTQNGEQSAIFGTAINNADATVSGTNDNFIFSGYKVYVTSDNSSVVGMDVILLNEQTGQFPSTLPSRIVALLVFIWWNIFQFISLRYMKRRDGPPLPTDNNNPWLFSIRTFYRTIKTASTYPHLFRYLICWFMFSDGLNTIGTAAVLFATIELGASTAEASMLLLEVMVLAAIGGVLFLWIQRKTHWDPKQMLLLHLCFYIAMPTYCVLGLIPNSPIGLVSKGEMFFFCLIYGINFGSTYSYARSVFTNIVPRGKEAEMFALFEITDKGSSWIGPLTTAIITNTLAIRWAMIYVVLFFVIPMPILIYGVNLEIGMKQAGRYENYENNDNHDIAIIDTNNMDINNMDINNMDAVKSDDEDEDEDEDAIQMTIQNGTNKTSLEQQD